MDSGRKPDTERKPNTKPDMNYVMYQLVSRLAEQEGVVLEDYRLERIVQAEGGRNKPCTEEKCCGETAVKANGR